MSEFPDKAPATTEADPRLDPPGAFRVEPGKALLDRTARIAVKGKATGLDGYGSWTLIIGPIDELGIVSHGDVADWPVEPHVRVAARWGHSAATAPPALLDGGDAEGAAPFKTRRGPEIG